LAIRHTVPSLKQQLHRETEPGLKNLRLFSGTLAVVTAFLVLPSSSRAATLFPKPLHLVRAVDDSISGKSTTLDEFCAGNRIVTVRGRFVTIVDYDKQEVTEIDHAAGTYSVTRFDDIAKARAQFAPKSTASMTAAAGPRWQTTPRGMKSSAGGRSLETVEIVREGGEGKEQIEVGIDRQVMLSREAVEALIGASYPNPHTEHHDLLLGAAGPKDGSGGRASVASVGSGAADAYGLPSEQTMTFEAEGNRVVTHNRVVSVGNETVPPEALNIEPGAHRVESKATLFGKELQQLDQLPAPGSKQ
jgi:hypothetical protein